MGKWTDEDGVDGPFERAMRRAEREDDRDARAFQPHAGAIEALIETDIPLQVQHAPKRGGLGTRCGEAGQVAPMGIGVTCTACLAKAGKRGRGRRAA